MCKWTCEGQSLELPTGWTAGVRTDITGARLAAFDADGRLLVSSGDGGSVTTLTPTEVSDFPTYQAPRELIS